MSWVAVAVAGTAALAGGIKAAAVDAPKAARQRQLQAATARYSPWTGLKPETVQEADPFGSALQFGAAGAQLGQGIKNANASNNLANSQSNWLNAGGSPYTSAAVGGNAAPSLGNYQLPPSKINPWSFS